MASKVISNLSIVLGATVSPFVAAMNGARYVVGGFTGAIGNAGSALARMTGLSKIASAALAAIRGSGSSLLGIFASLTGAGLAVNLLTSAFRRLASAPGEAIAAAQRQSDAETKLRSVLAATGGAAGRTADQMFAYASSLQQSTTFGDEAIIEFQSVLATFKNVSGDVFDSATKAALDMSTVLGGDLQSTAIQLGKALNDPTEGLKALSRVGVSFTATQKAQIATMQAAGDIAGAQAVILAELKSEFGGAAEAIAKTPFGRLKQLSNAFGDAVEQVGGILASFGATFADAFDLRGAIGSLQASLTRISGVVTTGVGTYAPLVAKALSTVWSYVTSIVGSIYGYVAPMFARIYAVVAANWQSVAASTIDYLAVAYNAVVGAFSSIVSFVGTSGLTVHDVLVEAASIVGVVVGAYAVWQASGLVVAAAQYGLAAASGVASLAMYGISTAATVVGAAQTVMSAILTGAVSTYFALESAWTTVTFAYAAAPATIAAVQAAIAAMSVEGVAAAATSGVLTAAQWALNVALDANPIGLVIVAVAGLAAWFAYSTDKASLFSSAMAYLKTGAAIASTAFSNLGLSAKIVGVAIAYELAKIGNVIAYTFTQVAPALLAWFGRNWRAVLIDTFNLTSTVFANMGKNVGAFFTALKGALAGKGFHFDWTPLAQGFTKTMEDLPKIAERQAGPLEASLGKQLDGLDAQFKDAMKGTVPAPSIATPKPDVGEQAIKSLTDQIAGAKPPEIAPPTIGTGGLGAATDAMDGLGAATDKAAQSFDTLRYGSAEALASIAKNRFDASIVPFVPHAAASADGSSASTTPQVAALPQRATNAIASATKNNKDNTKDEIVQILRDWFAYTKANPSIDLSEAA